MRKITPFLLAAALVIGVAAFAPVPAQANIWCMQCAADPGDCFACCKCAGYTTYYCAEIACGAPDSMLTTVTLEATPFDMSIDKGEACSAEQEAGTEAANVDEAPAKDEAVKDEAVKTEEITATATQ